MIKHEWQCCLCGEKSLLEANNVREPACPLLEPCQLLDVQSLNIPAGNGGLAVS